MRSFRQLDKLEFQAEHFWRGFWKGYFIGMAMGTLILYVTLAVYKVKL